SSSTDVKLNWISDGDSFDVEWGLAGFELGTGTQITGITTNSTDLTILGNTLYQFYIRQDCGSGNVSSWAGPFSFQSEYCQVTSTSTAYGISNFVTTGGILNINNPSTGGSYSDYTAQTVAQFEGGSIINFTITSANGSAGMGVWIDW